MRKLSLSTLLTLTTITLTGLLGVTAFRLRQAQDLSEDLRWDLMFAELDARDLAIAADRRADRQAERDPLFVYRAGAATPQGPYADPLEARQDAEDLARQWPDTPVHLLVSSKSVMTPPNEPHWDGAD